MVNGAKRLPLPSNPIPEMHMRPIFCLSFLVACGDSATDGLTSLSIEASSTEVDSRTTIDFTVTGSYEDGTEADLSSEVEFISSDEDVLLLGLVQQTMGHGIGEGVATVHAVLEDFESDAIDVSVSIAPVQVGDLVINELLADDGDFDTNGDGTSEDEDDEFIELLNVGFYTIDLGGIMIRDSNYAEIGPRHIFASPTHVRPGEAVVVFGGGSVDGLSVTGTQFFVTDNEDTGLNHGLSLNNGGEYISLVNDEGLVLVNLAYGTEDDTGEVSSVDDASINRSPDMIGPGYTDHRLVDGTTSAHSVGTQANGEPFPGIKEWYALVVND